MGFEFKRNEFKAYMATKTIHLGPIADSVQEGEFIETDGWKVRWGGQEFAMPHIKNAIKKYWFILEDDTSGRGYVPLPAGVQMHAPVPDRDGNRRALQMNMVIQEDHHVVGSVVGSNLGAQSKRTGRVAARRDESIPDISGMGNHQPLGHSDPRHSTSRVHSSQISQRDVYATRVDQVEVARIGPTQKEGQGRTIITPGNSHMGASSVLAASAKRAQARQINSRQRMEAARAQNPGAHPAPIDYAKGGSLRGQHVGVSSLGDAGGPRHGGGGSLNQQDAQVVRTIHQPDGTRVEVSQQPVPQPVGPPLKAGAPVGAPDAALWAEFQQFRAFKNMQSGQDAQGRAEANELMRRAQVASDPAASPIVVAGDDQGQKIPSQAVSMETLLEEGEEDWEVSFAEAPVASSYDPGNWRDSTKSIKSWHKRFQAAVDHYGNDPKALTAIMAVETPGVVSRLREHLGMDVSTPEGPAPE